MAEKKNNFKELSTEDLLDKIQQEKSRYQQQKFSDTISAVEDSNVFKNIRRDIARMKTELRARIIEQKQNS